MNVDPAYQIRCGPAGGQFAGDPRFSGRGLPAGDPGSPSRCAALPNDDGHAVGVTDHGTAYVR